MKAFTIIFSILLIILFIPFPLKLTLHASKNDFYIKLYGYTLMSKEKLKRKKKKKKHNKFSKKFDFSISNSKKFASRLYYSKLKPFLYIDISFTYSFNDAATTAVSYGALSEIPNILYLILKILFKPHKYNFSINPVFKDNVILNFEIKSIIFLSFAHIINILIVLIKSYKKTPREVTP